MQKVLLALLACFFLISCSTSTTHQTRINPRSHRDQTTLFGYFKIVRERKNITENAIVYVGGLPPFKLQKDGYAVIFADPNKIYRVEKIEIPELSKEYVITNMLLLTGPLFSKTYFGDVTVQIREYTAYQGSKEEEWRWFVRNHWKKSVDRWNKENGRSWRKTVSALARKDVEQTQEDGTGKRQVASDREAVVLGF